ncbi:MAG: C4-type zinc ribbon domain-containing protein [Marinilabiliales bacterium]
MTTSLKENQAELQDVTIEEKLKSLLRLQLVDSEIDKIRILRGELPLEVQDLEDEIEGLDTRIKNYYAEIENYQNELSKRKIKIKECEDKIKKYTEQQKNVRNNREFDSLSKEIEFQTLEIELAKKHIGEFEKSIEEKNALIEVAKKDYEDRLSDLKHKKQELDEIITENQKEEEDLLQESAKISKEIDKRLLTAYRRIRKNARNGLAVVSIERDACGGCFNKIPPQRQLDIRTRKKIIVCEYCGRILVDQEMVAEITNKLKKN